MKYGFTDEEPRSRILTLMGQIMNELATNEGGGKAGRSPSVRQTEQNEQFFGHPGTVCIDAHMYRSEGSKSQRPPKK